MRKRNKLFNSKFLLIVIIMISVGFAALSRTLTINGITNVKGNTWSIYFDNVQVESGSVALETGDHIPTISQDKLTVDFEVTLTSLGDYYEFDVDVINDGTLDAQVDTVINNSLTNAQKKYLNFTIEYSNGDPLEQGYILMAGQTKTYRVRVEYRLDVDYEYLPSQDHSVSLSFSCKYTQADENSYKVATFKTGPEVANKMIELAGVSNESSKVKSFKRANTLLDGLNSNNIISITDSDMPIYMWFVADPEDVNEYGTIFWYSDADVIYLNKDSSFLFYKDDAKFSNLSDISGVENLNTSKVKSLSGAFADCFSLTNVDALENWDTRNLTNLSFTFAEDVLLSNLDGLASWDVSKVIDMSGSFVGCLALSDISGLSLWNVENVIDLSYTFESCESLSNFNPLSGWDIGNVKLIRFLFTGCHSLSSLSFISGWDVSSVTDASFLFYHCIDLTSTSGFESLEFNCNALIYTFYCCTSLTNISSLLNYNLNNVIYLNAFFAGCSSLSNISVLSSWNVSNVISLSGMFADCTSLSNVNALSGWDVSSVIDLDGIFLDCSNLTNIQGLQSWNVVNVKDMEMAFRGCSNLIDISPLSGWNTCNVMYMHEMFNDCDSLIDASPIDGWNVSKVSDMDYMFPSNTTILPSWYA